MLNRNKNAMAVQAAATAKVVTKYFEKNCCERNAEGKYKVHSTMSELDKRSIPFFSILMLALDGDDMEEGIRDFLSALCENKVHAAAKIICLEIAHGDDSDKTLVGAIDTDDLIRCIKESICLEPPCSEYLNDLYFVKVCLPHLDIGTIPLEPAEVSLDDLRARNQLCGECRYELDTGKDAPTARLWELYADISLKDALRIVYRDSGAVCLPAGTVIIRDGQPTKKSMSGIDIPINQIEVFSLGWYDD